MEDKVHQCGGVGAWGCGQCGVANMQCEGDGRKKSQKSVESCDTQFITTTGIHSSSHTYSTCILQQPHANEIV